MNENDLFFFFCKMKIKQLLGPSDNFKYQKDGKLLRLIYKSDAKSNQLVSLQLSHTMAVFVPEAIHAIHQFLIGALTNLMKKTTTSHHQDINNIQLTTPKRVQPQKQQNSNSNSAKSTPKTPLKQQQHQQQPRNITPADTRTPSQIFNEEKKKTNLQLTIIVSQSELGFPEDASNKESKGFLVRSSFLIKYFDNEQYQKYKLIAQEIKVDKTKLSRMAKSKQMSNSIDSTADLMLGSIPILDPFNISIERTINKTKLDSNVNNNNNNNNNNNPNPNNNNNNSNTNNTNRQELNSSTDSNNSNFNNNNNNNNNTSQELSLALKTNPIDNNTKNIEGIILVTVDDIRFTFSYRVKHYNFFFRPFS